MQHETKEYKIVSEIGAGGMAVVYKAIQKSLGRAMVIKKLKDTFHADEQIVLRFEREAKVSASLQHENIVHIYDYWGKPDYCIMMEYVDGTNLADIIEKTGALPADVGTMIALQVCSALEYAHMRGLVHRDIKPGNIMVKRNGEVKLMDFGIARTKQLKTLTLPGTFLGTPAYMSPEQILGQEPDNRSDIFSFGIVLYEIFTGVKPFQDEDTDSVSAKILRSKFLPPRRINDEIPRRLQRVIKKCLKKKPEKRYRSVQGLSKRLGKVVAGRTDKSASLKRISSYLTEANIFEAPPEGETMVTTNGAGYSVFRKILYGTAAVLVLLIGAAGYYWNKVKQASVLQPGAEQPAAGAPAQAGPAASSPSAAQPLTSSTSTAVKLRSERAAGQKKAVPSKTKKKKTHRPRSSREP